MTYHKMTVLFSVDGEEGQWLETYALDRHDVLAQLSEIYAGTVEVYQVKHH